MNTINKLPEITLLFWIMKICATTLGETAGDLLSMTLHIGYATSSLLLIGLFFIAVIAQLATNKYHPTLYWLVILSTSTAGTTMSDYMDRTLGLGYANGSMVLITLLMTVLLVWKLSVGSLAVSNIQSKKVEALYWIAILFSNTLGTALGDYLADDSGLGFAGGAALIAGILLLLIAANYLSPISKVLLFWLAFILTRPFGATMGDVLTKSHEKGGLDFGTIGSSAVLATILAALVIYTFVAENRKITAATLAAKEHPSLKP